MIYCPYCQPVVSGWMALACADCTELLMELSMVNPADDNQRRLADPADPLVKLLNPPEVEP